MGVDTREEPALLEGRRGLFCVVLCINLAMLHADGTTPGKRLMKIRIVASDGRPAKLWKIVLLRMLSPWVIGYLCGIFGLIDALFIFRRDQRCIHDHMADTVVIEWR